MLVSVKYAHARRFGGNPPENYLKFALLRLNLEAVLTENYKTVFKCCGGAGLA